MPVDRVHQEVQQALARIDAAVSAGDLSPGASANLKNWLAQPAYRDYHGRLIAMVGERKFAELDGLFWEVIPFGTGGRRGRMADLGSATMNARTIAESAHGMAVYLRAFKGAAGGRAVIAHDTRNRSVEFARTTATTLAAHGLTVFLFDGHRSTPELSFAVRHLGCDIGAMISASHNPPSDNGFKAYWSSGAQVLPPHDRGIIDCVAQAGDIPTVEFDRALADGRIRIVGEEIDRAYAQAVTQMSLSGLRDVRAVFTPLHGVGETSVFRVLREAGFGGVDILESQRTPDGNFPGVPAQLPNPELPGAFGPAIEQAQAGRADLVLASDPDADRLGVAVRDPQGRYVILTGNQVGALLMDYVLRKRSAAGTLSPSHFVCTTLVSTPLVRAVGERHGVTVIDDLLVGFKYIAETMDARGADRFVFGMEESLGYLAGTYCRDKDAAVAALYVLELAAELKQRGKTLLDGLDELYEAHGYFVEGQQSASCQGARGKEQIDALMRTFRTHPPANLGKVRMVRLRDYREQSVRSIPESRPLGSLHTVKGDLLFLDSDAGQLRFSIAVRPSGTEPKIKFYFFARGERTAGEPIAALKVRVDRCLSDLQEALADFVKQALAGPAT